MPCLTTVSVTLHDLKGPPSCNNDNELVIRGNADRQIINEPPSVNLNPTAQSFVPYTYGPTHNVSMPSSNVNTVRQICPDPSQLVGNFAPNMFDPR